MCRVFGVTFWPTLYTLELLSKLLNAVRNVALCRGGFVVGAYSPTSRQRVCCHRDGQRQHSKQTARHDWTCVLGSLTRGMCHGQQVASMWKF